MKMLICSLQVSHDGSKGHLHPAIELGLALKKRGHEILLLPLPCSLNKNDADLIKQCGFTLVEPPPLPDGLPLSAQELARLVKNPATTHLAYESFLIKPLQHQFDSVVSKLERLWRRHTYLRSFSLSSAACSKTTWH